MSGNAVRLQVIKDVEAHVPPVVSFDEKGGTPYAHVSYPLTGLTAEKHDSFFEPVGDGTAPRGVRR